MEKEIVNTLVEMYGTTDNERRQELSSSILLYGVNKMEFLALLIDAFRKDYTEHEKISCEVFFRSYLNTLIRKKEISSEERKIIFDDIFSSEPRVILDLIDSIEALLIFDQNDLINPQNLLDTYFNYMSDKIKEDNNNEYEKLKLFVRMFTAGTNAISDIDMLYEKFNIHKSQLVEAAEGILHYLKASFEQSHQQDAIKFSVLLFDWCHMIGVSFDKLMKSQNHTISSSEYFTSLGYVNVFFQIIFNATSEDTIILSQGTRQLTAIYKSKSEIIRIWIKLVRCINPSLRMKNLTDSHFEKLLQTCCSQFLAELLELSDTENLEDILANEQLREWVTYMLAMSSQLVNTVQYHAEYRKYGLRLLTDIGLTYSRTFIDEKREMIDNPAEFSKLALDVCDRQSYFVLKSQAAKFIEETVDKLTGMFIPFCEWACDILEYGTFGGDTLDNYPILKEHFEISTFMKYACSEDFIDTSLMMLTLVSYALPKDEWLKKRFTSVIEKATEPIISMDSLLLNCRVTVMLGYYMDILFINNDNIFFGLLDMFLKSLVSGDANLALAHQSTDTLNTIVNDNDILPRIDPMLPQLLKRVGDCVLEANIPEFFDFVSELFKFYKEKIQKDDFIKLFNCLIERICIEVNKASERQNNSSTSPIKTTMSAQKSWNVIMSILESEHYIKEYLPVMHEKLWVIFDLLANPCLIEFDDEIIKSINIVINHTNCVNDQMKSYFKYFGEWFRKHNLIYKELFEVIKTFCKHDKAFILSSNSRIVDIFSFGVQTLLSNNYSWNACVYLIQIFLLLRNDNNYESLNNVVPIVLDSVLKRLDQKPINKIYKRLLYGIILASLMSNSKAVFEYLQKNNIFEDTIKTILNFKVRKIEIAFERKLHAVVLTHTLSLADIPDFIKESSSAIIQKITDILVKTSRFESNKPKKKKVKEEGADDSEESDISLSEDEDDNEYNLEIGDEDEEDKDNNHDSSDGDEKDETLQNEVNILGSFNMMKTGFNIFDEFNYFKYVMSTLHIQNAAAMDELIAEMPQSTQNRIADLMKIQVVKNNKDETIHRKVVRVKRSGLNK